MPSPDSSALPQQPPETARQDPAWQLWRLWRQGQRPDLREFLAGTGPLPALRLVAVLRIDQRERWQRGERVPAEVYLRDYPAVAADPEAARDLVYGEILLREERGEAPDPDEYPRRFPQYADTLRAQVSLHRALAPPPAAGEIPSVNSASRDAPPEAAQVFAELRRHGLLDAARLKELALLMQARPLAARELGRELLRRDWLTPYQVNQLLQGRGRDLVLGGYVLLQRLGEGGMGTVFKAHQRRLDRVVALKVIRRDRLSHPDAGAGPPGAADRGR
jgi:hypothetical protein